MPLRFVYFYSGMIPIFQIWIWTLIFVPTRNDGWFLRLEYNISSVSDTISVRVKLMHCYELKRENVLLNTDRL